MTMTAVEFLASKGVKLPDDFFAHYGVPGMKWGRRKDRSAPSITVRGADGKVYNAVAKPGVSKKQLKAAVKNDPYFQKVPNTFSNKPKNRRMSDAELRAKVNRLQMEKQLKDLTAPTPKANSFIKQVLKESGQQAARTIAQRAVTAGINVALDKAAGRAVAGSTNKAFLDAMVAAGKKKK